MNAKRRAVYITALLIWYNKEMNRKQMSIIIGVIIITPLIGYGLYMLVLWGSWNFEADFVAQEQCLQNGGVYSPTQDRCWYAGQCEDEGGFWYPREQRCVYDESTIESSEGVI